MVVYLAEQTTRKPQNITNDELCCTACTAVEQIMYLIVQTLAFMSITMYLLAIFRIKTFTKNSFIYLFYQACIGMNLKCILIKYLS